MRETILLFHFTDREKRMKLARALMPLKIRIKDVEKKDYLKPVGYLAGNKEMPHTAEEYTGNELTGELFLMAGLSSARVDTVIMAMKKANVGAIPYKAVMTPTNQSWTVLELFREIQNEHELVQKKLEYGSVVK